MNDPQNRFLCAVCGTPSLMCCSQCNQIFYCSHEHQKQHWRLHKQDCHNFQQQLINQMATDSSRGTSNSNLHNYTPEKSTIKNNFNNIPSPNNNNYGTGNFQNNQTVPKNHKQTYSNTDLHHTPTTVAQNIYQPRQLTQSSKSIDYSPPQGSHTMFNIHNNKISNQNDVSINDQYEQNNFAGNQSHQYSPSPSSNIIPQNSSNNSSKNYLNIQGTPGVQQQLQSSKHPLAQTQNNQNNQELSEMSYQQLVAERQKLRSIMINMYGNFNYAACILPCKKLISTDKRIYDINCKYNELYEFLADHLFLSKVLIKIDKVKSARECLLIVQKTVEDLFDDEHLLLRREAVQMMRGEFQYPTKEIIGQMEELKSDVRKRCNILALCGNLFYAVGDSKNCEAMYVKYVKLVETIFGGEGLETSNCYFLVGVFYIQQKCFTKALACEKRALHIRRMKLGERHESVADCQYNIGIIFKQIGQKVKAAEYLNMALDARRELVGDVSLPVAQVLEGLGKVSLEDCDYKSALTKFQESYVIRKKILQNNSHPDMVRISLLIIHLFNCVKTEMTRKTQNKKTFELLQGITDQIKNSVLDPNLNSYINTDRSQMDRYSDLQSFYKVNAPSTSRQEDLISATDRDNQNRTGRLATSGDRSSPRQRTGGRSDEDQDDETNKRKNKYFQTSKELLSQFPVELLVALAALQDELKNKENEANAAAQLAQQQDQQIPQAQKFNPNLIITSHDFVKILSQNDLFYIQFQKENPHIFSDKNQEVLRQIKELDVQRNQKQFNKSMQNYMGQTGIMDYQPNFGGGQVGISNTMLGNSNSIIAGQLVNGGGSGVPGLGAGPLQRNPSGPSMITQNSLNPQANPYIDQLYQPYSHLQPTTQLDGMNIPLQGPYQQYQQTSMLQQQQSQQQQIPNIQSIQQRLMQGPPQSGQPSNLVTQRQQQLNQGNQNLTQNLGALNQQQNPQNPQTRPPINGISLLGMNSRQGSTDQLQGDLKSEALLQQQFQQQQQQQPFPSIQTPPNNQMNADQMQKMSKLMLQIQNQQQKQSKQSGDLSHSNSNKNISLLSQQLQQQNQQFPQQDPLEENKQNSNLSVTKQAPKIQLNTLTNKLKDKDKQEPMKKPFNVTTKSPRTQENASSNPYENMNQQDIKKIQQKLEGGLMQALQDSQMQGGSG